MVFDSGLLMDKLSFIALQYIGSLPVINDKGEKCVDVKLNKSNEIVLVFGEKKEGIKDEKGLD